LPKPCENEGARFMCRMPALSPCPAETTRKPLIETEDAPHASLLGVTEGEASSMEVALRTAANEPFVKERLDHELVLRRLWDLAFPERGGHAGFRWLAAEWAGLGFQSEDPLRDLRGSGLQGLSNLVQLLENRSLPGARSSISSDPAHVAQLLALPGLPPGFPLAIASINVTGYLQYFFGLNSVYPGSGARKGDAASQRGLVLLAAHEGAGVLQSLHDALLLRLAFGWSRLKAGATLMDFPPLLHEAFAHAASVFSGAPASWVLFDLVSELEGLELPRFGPIAALARFAMLVLYATCGCSWSLRSLSNHGDMEPPVSQRSKKTV